MYLSALSSRQAGILLPYLLCIPVHVLTSGLSHRAIEPNPDDGNCDETPILDGPTSDASPGIGVEFETGQILFSATMGPDKCDKSATQKSKGKLINNQQGTNWKLTGDSFTGSPAILDAEYILDGTKIKIGSGDAVSVASQVADDLTSWNPWNKQPNNVYNIEGSDCNPWEIIQPTTNGAFADLSWSPHITAPMPLEAINDLFAKAVSTNQASVLLPSRKPVPDMVHVTKDFFQSKFFQADPYKISTDKDILGFFSLILTYAKGAAENDPGRSPKWIGSIMPRTDYVTTFAQVKARVTGNLYEIVNHLACYKNDGDKVVLDSDYCTGAVAEPQPNGDMDKQAFKYGTDEEILDSLKVQDWMKSIQDGGSSDKLTQFDSKNFNGQIGGLGSALENVLNTHRAVPLFEFRRLRGVKQAGMKEFVGNAEQEIISYHKANAAPPGVMKRNPYSRYSHMKRQGASSACFAAATVADASKITAAPSTTPLCSLQNEDPDHGIFTQGCICGSVTLPLITVTSVTNQAQSCAYTALPTSSIPNPITIGTQTWTSNCQACTLIGGIADRETCTTVQGCTSKVSPTVTPTITPTPTARPLVHAPLGFRPSIRVSSG